MPSKFPKSFPCQDSVRQADYLEIFESGEDLLAKTLRFSWFHWLGCPRSPFLRYHQKKNLRGDCDVCGWRFEGPNPQAAVETLSQQPRCQRLGLLEAGKFWIFLGGLRWLAGKSTMEMKMYFLLKMWMFHIMSCQFSGVQCFTKTYPSWKLTAHPWKWMVGRYMNIWMAFPFEAWPIFRRDVNFSECTMFSKFLLPASLMTRWNSLFLHTLTHGQGWVGGVGMMTFLSLAHMWHAMDLTFLALAHMWHATQVMGRVGWVGWGWWRFYHLHTCDMLRTWRFLHLHTCDMLRKSWGGLGGWGGDDDVSFTCTHVTCYALDVSCTCTHVTCYGLGNQSLNVALWNLPVFPTTKCSLQSGTLKLDWQGLKR